MEKIVWKKCENTFFINTLIMWPKMGEITREKFFSGNTDFASNNDGKKSSWKSAKTRFFYENTNIVTKKWGGGENARKKFSKNTRIGYPKIVGKNRTNSARKKCWEKIFFVAFSPPFRVSIFMCLLKYIFFELFLRRYFPSFFVGDIRMILVKFFSRFFYPHF